MFTNTEKIQTKKKESISKKMADVVFFRKILSINVKKEIWRIYSKNWKNLSKSVCVSRIYEIWII